MAGLMTACSVAMTVYGSRAARKTEHFKTYRKLLLRKKYANISDISNETGIPEKVVLSELKEFSDRKMIKQGHFDNKKTCFIASDSIYNDYLRTQEHAAEMKAAEEKKQRADAAVSPEVRELLEKGNEYIRMIHEANDRIPGEEVTAKLNRMEMIVRRIFEEVRKRPELAGSLNMFMNYYLPTTTKLINAYEQMSNDPVQGENITTAKREIENSLDTICDAYETLLDSFFRDTAMDVSSDINVMKMMMKQDGLTADDFTKMQNGQASAASNAQAQAGTAQSTVVSNTQAQVGVAQVQAGSGSTASAAQAMAGGQAQYEELK
jgi:5-bromo-4-chloroindolyl phosphate hydrolysis protein